jgi:hypothetical protein
MSTAAAMTQRRLRPAAAGVALVWLTLVGFGLRAAGLGIQPLWGDEGWSYYFAGMPLAEMLPLTARDIHPPLYYAILHGWLGLTGGAPEAARLLSVAAGTLLVPAIYRLATLLVGRRAGLAAAAVVAVAPLAVYYAQEVRMYGLVTLLGLASACGLVRLVSGRAGRLAAAATIVATAAALYTMYYAVLVVLAQAAWLVWVWLARRAGWQRLRCAAWALVVSVLLYLPWVVYAGGRLAGYVQGKRLAEGYLPLEPTRYVAAHLAAFSVGHPSDALAPLSAAALLFAAIATLGFVRRPAAPRALLPLFYLLIPLAGGFLVNLIYPFAPRYFERTLLLAAPAWWLLIGAGLAWLWHRSRAAVTGIGCLLLAVNVAGLIDFYSVPRYRAEDYRPLLAYVRTHSTSDDVILASYQWQLGLYQAYLPPPHPQFYTVPGWGEGWADCPDCMRADLARLIDDHPRLWFPAYQSLGRLWETQAEAILNRIAYPAQVDWNLPGTKLTLYGGSGPLTAAKPAFLPSGRPGVGNFAGRVMLDAVLLGSQPVEAGRGIVPVALTWRRLDDAAGTEGRVALQLVDTAGQVWAARDSRPDGGRASFASLAPGETMLDRHGVLVPAGTPPGEYVLRLSVVNEAAERPLDVLDGDGQPQGSAIGLGTVQVILPHVPLTAEALPIQHPQPADFAGGVRLLGYSLGDTPVAAGERLAFSLFWQALADQTIPFVVFAQLQDADSRPLALSETPPAYPADRWLAGMLLRDPRYIPLPPALPAGEYRLAVGLLRPDGSRVAADGTDQVILTRVPTTQREHRFEPPRPPEDTRPASLQSWHTISADFGNQARLVAWQVDATQSAVPGESLALTLHWQALAPFVRRYTVFVHLVDEQDRIFGQQDQEPGGGRFPTTGWVPGEYLADEYRVPINPATPAGIYYIEVGLYDPMDGTRLPVTAVGQAVPETRLLLRDTPIRVQ